LGEGVPNFGLVAQIEGGDCLVKTHDAANFLGSKASDTCPVLVSEDEGLRI